MSLCTYKADFENQNSLPNPVRFFPFKTQATLFPYKAHSTRLSLNSLPLSYHSLHPSASALSPYPLHPLLDPHLPHLRTHFPSPTHNPIHRTTMRDVRKATFRQTPLATCSRPRNTKSRLPFHSPQNHRRSDGREPPRCGARNPSQP